VHLFRPKLGREISATFSIPAANQRTGSSKFHKFIHSFTTRRGNNEWNVHTHTPGGKPPITGTELIAPLLRFHRKYYYRHLYARHWWDFQQIQT